MRKPQTIQKLKEQLAAIEHERWADWQRYMHSKMRGNALLGSDGPYGYYVSAGQFEGWERQINTPYDELSEREKDSDREQVERYWPLIESLMQEKERLAIIDDLEAVNDMLNSPLDLKEWVYKRIKELEQEDK